MALRDEFHRHLDHVWPLWRQHEGEMLYHLRWASFSAGHHLGANGAPAAAAAQDRGQAGQCAPSNDIGQAAPLQGAAPWPLSGPKPWLGYAIKRGGEIDPDSLEVERDLVVRRLNRPAGESCIRVRLVEVVEK